MNYQEFIRTFDPNSVVVKDEDDFDRFEYSCEFRFDTTSIPTHVTFESFFHSIRDIDDCTLTLSIGDGESLTVRKQLNYNNVISELQSNLSIFEAGEQLGIKIVVDKKNQNGNFFFYSQEGFYNYLNTCDILTLGKIFSIEELNNHPQICLAVTGFEGVLESSRITISSQQNIFSGNDTGYRQRRFDNINTNTHSTYMGSLKVLPEDFVFIGTGTLEPNLKSLFENLSLILSVSAIFDITDLTSDTFFFKLNGYKSISSTLDVQSLTLNHTKDYFKIYEWIYQSGSITDKIGLARNIISLHIKKDSSLELEGDVYESLMSSYKIYEKQNIKQYIEVRNKMSDQILDYSKRATTITENFAGGFQKSALTIVTFFSSIVVMRVLGNPTNTDDFATYSTWITVVFLIVTVLYMWISRRELKQQRTRFKKSYKDFKKRYTDLLTENDIARILNNDQEHNSDLKFISDKLKWYTILWWSVIGLITIAILGYYLYVIMSTLKDSMINFPNV